MFYLNLALYSPSNYFIYSCIIQKNNILENPCKNILAKVQLDIYLALSIVGKLIITVTPKYKFSYSISTRDSGIHRVFLVFTSSPRGKLSRSYKPTIPFRESNFGYRETVNGIDCEGNKPRSL